MATEPLDHTTLRKLREHHPAWRLLAATNAPFVISFLHEAFVSTNERVASQQSLAARLDDHLRSANTSSGADLPRSAEAYLDEWASDSNGWLRRFYVTGSDELQFDLTPAAERAITWVSRLLDRNFIGTQSRLLTVFQLLTEIIEGSDANPDTRILELQRRRDLLDDEIARLRDGKLEVMDPASVRERFQQMAFMARELLSDFRELEQSFHNLDRNVRRRISMWSGGRGALLDEILGDRDALSSSDQGVSFRAFWEFLMAPARQQELTEKLQRVFQLEVIQRLAPDARLRRIHFDWLAAAYVTQRTVARLSEQLRRYVDDRAFIQNRRIMELIRDLEQQAHLLKNAPPTGSVAAIDDFAPELQLPLERPLFTPPFQAHLPDRPLEAGDEDDPADELFNQIAVDRAVLRSNIQRALADRDRVSLAEVLAVYPLRHGLTEVVGYFAIAAESGDCVIDPDSNQQLRWSDRRGRPRSAEVPLVIFTRTFA